MKEGNLTAQKYAIVYIKQTLDSARRNGANTYQGNTCRPSDLRLFMSFATIKELIT